MTSAECVVDSQDHLGEGILWDDREQALYWLDVPMPSKLHRWYPDSGKHQSWDMPEMITSMSVREQGGLLIASHHGLNHFNFNDEGLVRILEPEKDQPENRCNDGASDRMGRFWFGTMQNNISPEAKNLPLEKNSGSLYRLDPDHSLHKMETDIGVSNTLAWSPDNTIMYFTDTLTGWISAFDYDHSDGTIRNRRNFAQSERGYPDGSTVDAEGYLWSCRWEGGCVTRFAPDGSIDQVVEVPVQRVTSCTFGGANLDTLYITTARWDMTEKEILDSPTAGCLFAAKPGVKGLSDSRFAG
ncbi:MAG: SMP-30/gluconolactonase/LRE family protein [SAR324 cluster bacterium]|nr:SMP-30/gluconolactonase/LRE family protein [SAR324 cluster bacterium]